MMFRSSVVLALLSVVEGVQVAVDADGGLKAEQKPTSAALKAVPKGPNKFKHYQKVGGTCTQSGVILLEGPGQTKTPKKMFKKCRKACDAKDKYGGFQVVDGHCELFEEIDTASIAGECTMESCCFVKSVECLCKADEADDECQCAVPGGDPEDEGTPDDALLPPEEDDVGLLEMEDSLDMALPAGTYLEGINSNECKDGYAPVLDKGSCDKADPTGKVLRTDKTKKKPVGCYMIPVGTHKARFVFNDPRESHPGKGHKRAQKLCKKQSPTPTPTPTPTPPSGCTQPDMSPPTIRLNGVATTCPKLKNWCAYAFIRSQCPCTCAGSSGGTAGTCCSCSSQSDCSDGMYCCPHMRKCVSSSSQACYMHQDCSPAR